MTVADFWYRVVRLHAAVGLGSDRIGDDVVGQRVGASEVMQSLSTLGLQRQGTMLPTRLIVEGGPVAGVKGCSGVNEGKHEGLTCRQSSWPAVLALEFQKRVFCVQSR